MHECVEERKRGFDGISWLADCLASQLVLLFFEAFAVMSLRRKGVKATRDGEREREKSS